MSEKSVVGRKPPTKTYINIKQTTFSKLFNLGVCINGLHIFLWEC